MENLDCIPDNVLNHEISERSLHPTEGELDEIFSKLIKEACLFIESEREKQTKQQENYDAHFNNVTTKLRNSVKNNEERIAKNAKEMKALQKNLKSEQRIAKNAKEMKALQKNLKSETMKNDLLKIFSRGIQGLKESFKCLENEQFDNQVEIKTLKKQVSEEKMKNSQLEFRLNKLELLLCSDRKPITASTQELLVGEGKSKRKRKARTAENNKMLVNGIDDITGQLTSIEINEPTYIPKTTTNTEEQKVINRRNKEEEETSYKDDGEHIEGKSQGNNTNEALGYLEKAHQYLQQLHGSSSNQQVEEKDSSLQAFLRREHTKGINYYQLFHGNNVYIYTYTYRNDSNKHPATFKRPS